MCLSAPTGSPTEGEDVSMATKVMIVDDDRNICELLRLYLEKEGWSVVMAHDGMQALTMFDAEKPDLVLLDVMMPQLDG